MALSTIIYTVVGLICMAIAGYLGFWLARKMFRKVKAKVPESPQELGVNTKEEQEIADKRQKEVEDVEEKDYTEKDYRRAVRELAGQRDGEYGQPTKIFAAEDPGVRIRDPTLRDTVERSELPRKPIEREDVSLQSDPEPREHKKKFRFTN